MIKVYKDLRKQVQKVLWTQKGVCTTVVTAGHCMCTHAELTSEHALDSCCSCCMHECRTRNFQVAGLNLTAGHLQATLNKLLTYGVLRSTQPPTLRWTGNA